MRTGHLFAGVGGGILADLILGHTPIFAVEMEKYRCEILRKFPNLHVHCGDIREWDPGQWAGRVDCISAGFPCQDISVAGTGKGLKGTRSGLFWEVMRTIDAILPLFVFLENSPAIRTRGRRTVIAELVARGYSWRDGVYRASHLGAPHRRDRWFLLAANADGMRQLQRQGSKPNERGRGSDSSQQTTSNPVQGVQSPQKAPRSEEHGRNRGDSQQTIANPNETRCEGRWFSGKQAKEAGSQKGKPARGTETPAWLPIISHVGRMVHGVPDWTHIKGASIRGLGDAQIPLQAAYAFKDLSR